MRPVSLYKRWKSGPWAVYKGNTSYIRIYIVALKDQTAGKRFISDSYRTCPCDIIDCILKMGGHIMHVVDRRRIAEIVGDIVRYSVHSDRKTPCIAQSCPKRCVGMADLNGSLRNQTLQCVEIILY